MKWINVKDRLPDNDDEVFAIDKENSECFKAKLIDGIWLDTTDGLILDVTHWCPLD